MKVSFVNYPLQYKNLEKEIDVAIKDVLRGGELILRKEVEEFEKNLSSFLGTKYAVGVNSGTDALIFSLRAAGVGVGDEVITVSHTFVASIAAIIHVGAKPILVDVKEDFLIDVEQIEPMITAKTKAIIPVHLNGRVCQMDRLMEIAQKHNLIVIEDAAQALGARFKEKTAGSFGFAGCFSFYPAKLLGAAGDAGAVVTNDEVSTEKIRLLRNHGQKKRSEGKTEILLYGETSRLDNLQAAILNVKFKYLLQWIDRRREIAKIYNDGLKDVLEIKLPPPPDLDEEHFDIYQNYVLRTEKRDKLKEFLTKNGIETLIKDPIPNHWQKDLNLSHFHLPITERLAEEVISLPIYPELKNSQIEYVINCIKKFYG